MATKWRERKTQKKKKKQNESNLNREQCWSEISGGQLLNLRLTNAVGVFVSSCIRIVCLLGGKSHPSIVCAPQRYIVMHLSERNLSRALSYCPRPSPVCLSVSLAYSHSFIHSLRSFSCQPRYLWLLYVLENTFTMTTFILHCKLCIH